MRKNVNKKTTGCDALLCTRGNVPLAFRLISSVNYTAYGSQTDFFIPVHLFRSRLGSLKGGVTVTSSTVPPPHHPLSYISHSDPNIAVKSFFFFFCPCTVPAQPRVDNACAMHGWTNARMVTMFLPEHRRRNCSDISDLLLCTTCWLGTFPTTNFI